MVRDDAAGPVAHFPRWQRINYLALLAARFFLAGVLTIYGMAKLVGTQFTYQGLLIDVPISQLPGMQRTWVYFGSSPLMSGSVAWAQIVGAALLLFNPTRRLGMLIVCPILTVIVLTNLDHDIGDGPLYLSIFLIGLDILLLLSEWPNLRPFLWDSTTAHSIPAQATNRTGIAVRWLFLIAAVGGSWFLLSSLKAGYTTPLTGDWRVKELRVAGQVVSPGAGFPDGWNKVYFEPHSTFSVRTAIGFLKGRYKRC